MLNSSSSRCKDCFQGYPPTFHSSLGYYLRELHGWWEIHCFGWECVGELCYVATHSGQCMTFFLFSLSYSDVQSPLQILLTPSRGGRKELKPKLNGSTNLTRRSSKRTWNHSHFITDHCWHRVSELHFYGTESARNDGSIPDGVRRSTKT